jgi:FlaA1/EpsC-like NDP-sugar epimerase
MSRDQVSKYFEVRLFSLAIVAVMLFILFAFFFFFFLWQGQYLYSVLMVALAATVLLAALRLWQYAKLLKKGGNKETTHEDL